MKKTWNTSYYDWGSWNDWNNYGNNKILDNFSIEALEEKLNRKKVISEEINKLKENNNIIAKTYIGRNVGVTRSSGVYNLSIPNTKNYRGDLGDIQDKILKYKKIPDTPYINNLRHFTDYFIECWSNNQLFNLFSGSKLEDIEIKNKVNLIYKIIDKDFLIEDDIKNIINIIPQTALDGIKGTGHGGLSHKEAEKFYTNVGHNIKISPKPNKIVKNSSLFRGKKINRAYINHTDYKALEFKRLEKNKKKKLLFLLDGSGSMAYKTNGATYYQKGLSFLYNLNKLKTFDIEAYHTCGSYVTKINFLNKDKDDIKGYYCSGDEGFPLLIDRLGDLSRDEDYVIVLTDMEVPDDAEDNLKLFIGSKKHLVLSFGKQRQFYGLNVRYVNEYKDILNTITTIL